MKAPGDSERNHRKLQDTVDLEAERLRRAEKDRPTMLAQ